MEEFKRVLKFDLPQGQSAFLWGARRTGKSFYLKRHFPDSKVYDLLMTDEYWRLLDEPSTLRREVLAMSEQELAHPIIIDEVQLLPLLLNEVHWLIENSSAYFILCGSSARKLRREGANLLGGRAWRYQFYPLTYAEIPDFDLLNALSHGLIPAHYLSVNIRKSLTAYVQNYLTEEIKAEGLVRNLVAFSKFLKVAAHSNAEMLNYTNIAQDCGISSKTVKEYYEILEDTLLGYFIYPFKRNPKRKDVVAMPKFYFFDVGVVNGLTNHLVSELTGTFVGQAFEHFILMELMAYKGLNDLTYDIAYWRTHAGAEVDFVLGEDAEIAIEVKLSNKINLSKLKGLQLFHQTEKPRRSIVICQVPNKQLIQVDGFEIEVYPWEEFLQQLWAGKIINS